jgi:peroxiredoxin
MREVGAGRLWLVTVGAVGLYAWAVTRQSRPELQAVAHHHSAYPSANQPQIGSPAPDFSLYADDGQEYRLSRLRGRKVLLNFLCGCSRCVDFAHEWERFHRTLPNVIVLGISTFGPSYLQKFRETTHATFPILFDPGFTVAELYRSVECPRSWVIDERGIVAYASRGRSSGLLTLTKLERLLIADRRCRSLPDRAKAEGSMAERISSRIEHAKRILGSCPVARTSWLPYLLLIALAQLTLLLYLLPRDRQALARIEELKAPFYRVQRARQLAALMRDDPRPGIKVIAGHWVTLQETLRERTRGKQVAVLLFIGSCSSCVERDLMAWRQVASTRKNPAVIIVSHDTPQGVAEYVRSRRFPLPIVPDPHGEMAKGLNVLWAPRAYAVTGEGRLTWVQKNQEMSADMIAQEVWQQGRS